MAKGEVRCVWDAGAILGEGVFWHPDESAVYWVDILRSQLHRLRADSGRDTWDLPGRPSAVVPCADGGLLATFETGIGHIDTDSATVTSLLQLETDLPRNRFNDGHSDTRGNFWFGSMDDLHEHKTGHFYRMDRRGNVQRLDAFGKICITNGPAFSTDGKSVYFTDSLERLVYRAALDGEGHPGARELYIDFSSQPGAPDGMCTDTSGGLWICQFGGHRVTRFDRDANEDEVIELPVPNITKCAFGSSRLDTLYITTAAEGLEEAQLSEYPLSGGLFKVTTNYRGVAPIPVPRPAAR